MIAIILQTFSTQNCDVTCQQVLKLKGLPIIHHHGYVCELPPKHRFPMRKFHGVLQHLLRDGVISKDYQVI